MNNEFVGTENNELVLVANDIFKSYPVGSRSLLVLKGVNLEIGKNEIVAIIGPSGAGKSTLLHLLGLLDKPSTGEIYLEDTRTKDLTEDECAYLRNRKIGMIFQFHHLLPEFTVWENTLFPGLIAGREVEEIKEKAQYLLTELGLRERLTHRPNEISFGEAQRVAIARTLLNDPKIILADEPTGNLDWETGEEVRNLLWEQVRHRGCSMLFVTHDEDLAKGADRVLIMINGKLEETKQKEAY